MIERYYRLLFVRDGQVRVSILRRGKFLTERHFTNLLGIWSGDGMEGYVHYPVYNAEVADPPELLDHTGTLTHLAR